MTAKKPTKSASKTPQVPNVHIENSTFAGVMFNPEAIDAIEAIAAGLHANAAANHANAAGFTELASILNASQFNLETLLTVDGK